MDRMARREAVLGKLGAEGAVATHTIAAGGNPVVGSKTIPCTRQLGLLKPSAVGLSL